MITHPPGWTASGAVATKVSKYMSMQRCHLFVPPTLVLYGAMDINFDMFVRECVKAYHTKRNWVSLSLAYCIAYLRQHVSIALQRTLDGAIYRRALTLGDTSSDALLFVDHLT
ncbi:hypothetical protein Mapa_011072 [Marchantia paleacea]|nr:hypothetical protein Mapa_011072 [Marchantia paleacea]